VVADISADQTSPVLDAKTTSSQLTWPRPVSVRRVLSVRRVWMTLIVAVAVVGTLGGPQPRGRGIAMLPATQYANSGGRSIA
jgi:hypothetical protein